MITELIFILAGMIVGWLIHEAVNEWEECRETD